MTDETREVIVARVNRVEYIDTTGRVLVRYLDQPGIVLSFQDGGETLKLFTADKFATFADPTAAAHAALDPFFDAAERDALLAELDEMAPDAEYMAEAAVWLNAPLGPITGGASSGPPTAGSPGAASSDAPGS